MVSLTHPRVTDTLKSVSGADRLRITTYKYLDSEWDDIGKSDNESEFVFEFYRLEKFLESSLDSWGSHWRFETMFELPEKI